MKQPKIEAGEGDTPLDTTVERVFRRKGGVGVPRIRKRLLRAKGA